MLLDKVKDLLAQNDWVALDNLLLPLCEERTSGLEAVLLYSASLRARNDGINANQSLLKAASRRYAADITVWSQFAEELMSSGLWHKAKDVITKISHADIKLGNFLQLIFFRETENWIEFEKSLKLVNDYEPELARIQAAWAAMRRGHLENASALILELRHINHPAVIKLHARYNILQKNIPLALEQIKSAKKKQPLDWECLALEAICIPEKAIELWGISLSRQPAQLETLVNRAAFYARNSQWNLAKNDCLEAIEVKPWSDLPVILWVQCLLSQRKQDEAWEFLQEKISKFPTPGRIAAQIDLKRQNTIKVSEIKKAAEFGIKKYPEDQNVLLSAGAAFQVARQIDKAANCYRKRLEILPNDIATCNNLAQLYLERGDIELAIDLWRKIEHKADHDILLNLAQALQQRGDMPDAEDIYRRVLTENSCHPVAIRGLADALAIAGDYQQAWDFALKSIQINPEHPRTWLLAANLQGPLGTPDKREELLSKGESSCKNKLVLRQALFKLWRGSFQTDKAVKEILRWIENEPNEAEYLLMKADLLYDLNNFSECESALKQADVIDWQVGGAALVRYYESRNRLGAARKRAEQMVRQDSAIMKHHGLLAEVLYRQERYDEALYAIDTALNIEPFRLSLVRQKIGILLTQERFFEAINSARSLLNHEPCPPHMALVLNAYRRSLDYKGALNFCYEMLQKYPKHRVISLWLAENLVANQDLSSALIVIKDAWLRDQRNLKLAASYINFLMQSELYEDAFRVAKDTIAISGERPDGIIVLSEVLRNIGRTEEALVMVEAGIIKFKNHMGLAQKRVEYLRKLGRAEEEKLAILTMMNCYPEEQILPWACQRLQQLGETREAGVRLTAWQNKDGNSLVARWAAFEFSKVQRQPQLAHKLLDAIERRKPSDPDVLLARAALHSEAWRMSEAIDLIRQLLILRPDKASYVQVLLNYLVKAGDFDEFDSLMNQIKHLYGDQRYSQYANLFFNINCHPEWNEKKIFDFYCDWYSKSVLPLKPPAKKYRNSIEPLRKLKIGYVSPDFRRHAVSYFSEPLMVKHDRDQFELFAFAHLEIKTADDTTERFKSYFDKWIETSEMSNDELEKIIIDNEIDILIDLAGHTANHSLNVFVRKPAPIQASYIFGAGQTTGLPEVDYLISDLLTIPPEHDNYVVEKVCRLPFAGLPYQPAHDYLEPQKLPFERNGFITFGVMSRPLRTNRRTIAVWANILRQLPSAKLRFDHMPYAEIDLQNRFKKIFSEFNIDESQLIFQNTRPHWKAYHDMDIQLDPFPAGSGTTITEGLWMERTAIALNSRPPMGRIAVAQLTALGLDQDCCAINESEYVEKAVRLALNTEKLKMLSDGLREKMKKSRLMNYKAYAVDVATCYRNMWIEYCHSKGAE